MKTFIASALIFISIILIVENYTIKQEVKALEESNEKLKDRIDFLRGQLIIYMPIALKK